MERHAKVEDGCIVIGRQKYSQVILVQDEVLFDSTRRLLAKYQARGGKMVLAEELAAVPVMDSPKITYTCRELEDCKVHFFVNTNREQIKAQVLVKDKKLDIVAGAPCSMAAIRRR